MELDLPDGVIMTKNVMTIEEALYVLEHPQNYVCISSPPIKPKGSHIYLYRALDVTMAEDWRCDQYRWMNGGVSKLPRKDPKLKKFYFAIDTPDGMSKRFQRHCYQLVGDKTLTLMHYIGLEAVAVDFWHRSAKKETGKVFIRTFSSLRKKAKASQAKERMMCKQEIPAPDITYDFGSDSVGA